MAIFGGFARVASALNTKIVSLFFVAVLTVWSLGVQAGPIYSSLDLNSNGGADLLSSFINVDYDASSGALVADGYTTQLRDNLGVTHSIFNGDFDLDVLVAQGGNSASGNLVISGELEGTSGVSTLLEGSLHAMATGVNDPLEFLFEVTGGDMQSLFGSQYVGVILSFSGYEGSLASDFSQSSFNGLSDTFAVVEPGTLGLIIGGLSLIGFNRRRNLT